MPFDVAKIKDRVKKLKKRFEDGQELNVSYRPHVFTTGEQLEFESRLNDESLSSEERFAELSRWTVAHVAEWDVVDEAGAVPIDEESLTRLPFDALMFVFNTIVGDKTGGKALRTR